MELHQIVCYYGRPWYRTAISLEPKPFSTLFSLSVKSDNCPHLVQHVENNYLQIYITTTSLRSNSWGTREVYHSPYQSGSNAAPRLIPLKNYNTPSSHIHQNAGVFLERLSAERFREHACELPFRTDEDGVN